MEEYLDLRRAGRTFKACCPFHESKHGGRERTPSLFVYPDRQMWICYGGGCGAGGSVIDFIMRIENLTFPDALKFLAKRAGIELEDRRPKPERKTGEIDRDGIFKLLAEVGDFFRVKYPGSKAQAYVAGRQLSPEIAEAFGLGYAPDSFEALHNYFGRRWGKTALVQAGLAIERAQESGSGSGSYDRFRDRLMIPIADPTGQIVGFGGRDLGGETNAKYINTPQTEVYNKSRVLFGIDRARDTIRHARRAVVMEGYFDVMMAHQFGITNAVATCGTALTDGHLTLLRQADRVTVLFDGDVPGIRAAERALETIVRKEINADIVILPDDLDPADFLLAQGAEAFQHHLDGATGIVDFKAASLRQRYDFRNPVEQRKAVSECLDLVLASPSPVFRDALLQRFAEALGMSEEALRKEAQFEDRKRTKHHRFSAPSPAESADRAETEAGANTETMTTTAGAGAETEAMRWARARRMDDVPTALLEETALACVIMAPALAVAMDMEFTGFPDAELQAIADAVSLLATESIGCRELVAGLFDRLDDAPRQRLVRLIAMRIGESNLRDADDDEDETEAGNAGGLLGVMATPEDVFADCVAERRRRLMAVEAQHLKRGLRGETSDLRSALDRRNDEPHRESATATNTPTPPAAPPSPSPSGISDDAKRRAEKHLELLRRQKGRPPTSTPTPPP